MVQRTKQEMYPLVEAWQASGQSKTSFCNEHQIKLHTFIYWTQKYEEEEQQSKEVAQNFVSLAVRAMPSVEEEKLEFCYPNGVRLRVGQKMELNYIKSLLHLGE